MPKEILRLVFSLAAVMLSSLMGCNQFEVPTKTLIVDFRLSKLDGTLSDSFHAGEKFDMRLVITNRTGEIRRYSYTEPNYLFKISKNDTVVITSIDGLLFPQVFVSDSIMPDQTVSYNWLAPTSVYYPDGFQLTPGKYQALGLVQLLFDKYSPKAKMMTDFYIIP